MANKADIKLLVGIHRTNSYALIDADIVALQQHVDKKKLKVKVELKKNGADWKSQVKDLQSQLDKTKFKITVSQVKVSPKALKNIGIQIKNAINASLASYVPNIGGGKGGSSTNYVRTAQQQYAQAEKEYNSLLARMTSAGAKTGVAEYDNLIKLQNELRSYKGVLGAAVNAKDNKAAQALINSMADLKIRYLEARNAAEQYIRTQKDATRFGTESVREQYRAQRIMKESDTLLQHITKMQQSYTAARKGVTSAEYQKLSDYAKRIEYLNQQYDNGVITVEEYRRQLTNLKTQVTASETAIKAAGEATLSFGDRLKNAASKFTQWFSVSSIIMRAVRVMRQIISTSIELDSAMTQLRIVTGATNDEMKEFSFTAVDLAKSLGQSVTSVTKSIEVFSRLGYNLKDASALAKYATVLANVASVDVDSATTGVTSIIKGYGMSVDNAEHVADVLIEVGQKYAISAGELMEAFQRSGAALNATNTSFEKSAGLLAAANAAVQDSSTIGTALKTVSARIRGSKSELEELGEDTEELAGGFSKYAEEFKALTNFDIMSDAESGTFKDIYDIFEGTANVWDKLSDTQRARVSEILGGTRQLQVITSILTNWKDAAGAYADAMDSAGVSTEANNKYMESTQAHIEQFKATLQELSLNSRLNETSKAVVDIGTGLLNVFSTITKMINIAGTLPGIAATIAGILSIKNVGELINQFRFRIILRYEYAHEAFN